MRYIETSRFGRISLREDSIFTFDDGIVGFEELREFALLGIEEYLPFLILASLDSHHNFHVVDPFPLFPSYRPPLPGKLLDSLRITRREDVQLYCFVSFEPGGHQAFADLASPIVINVRSMRGRHVRRLRGAKPRALIDLREILARALA